MTTSPDPRDLRPDIARAEIARNERAEAAWVQIQQRAAAEREREAARRGRR